MINEETNNSSVNKIHIESYTGSYFLHKVRFAKFPCFRGEIMSIVVRFYIDLQLSIRSEVHPTVFPVSSIKNTFIIQIPYILQYD